MEESPDKAELEGVCGVKSFRSCHFYGPRSLIFQLNMDSLNLWWTFCFLDLPKRWFEGRNTHWEQYQVLQLQQGVWDALWGAVVATLLRSVPQEHSFTHTHPFCHRLTWQKSRWWKGNQACKKEAKKTGLFIASKISFAAKRSLKQKYQPAGWHPQPDFSCNHMAAQCRVSPSTYSFPPSAFQVLSVCSISSSLPWILGYNMLVLAIFFPPTFHFLDHQHRCDLDFLKHFSFSSGKFMFLSGICPLSSLHTQAKN